MAANINLCCPIEMEPKTLSEVELTIAREVAADVVQKVEATEASNIFMEGLAGRIEERGRQILNAVDGNDATIATNDRQKIETPCQCSVMSDQSPDQINLKEPLSAPF